MFILPKRKLLSWTNHSRRKMRFYRLSEARVQRILRSPQRIEMGIAAQTIAMMQTVGTKKNPAELWVMVEDSKNRRIVISAWRYPGVTKPRSVLIRSMLRNEHVKSIDG